MVVVYRHIRYSIYRGKYKDTSENSTHAMTPVSDKIAPPPPNGSVFVAGWHPTAPIAVPLTMIPELEGVGFGR